MDNHGSPGSSSGGGSFSVPSSGSSGGSSSVGCNEGSGDVGGLAGGNTNPAGSMSSGQVGDPINPEIGGTGLGVNSSAGNSAGSKNQTGCLPVGVMPVTVGGGSVGMDDGELNDFINNGPPGGIDPVKSGVDAAKDFVFEEVQELRDSTIGGVVEMTAKGTIKTGSVYVGFTGKFGSTEEFNPEGGIDGGGLSGGCGKGGLLGGLGSGGGCGTGGGCGAPAGTIGSGLISGGIGGGEMVGSSGGGCDFSYSVMNTLGFYSDPNPIEYNANISAVSGVERITGITKILK